VAAARLSAICQGVVAGALLRANRAVGPAVGVACRVIARSTAAADVQGFEFAVPALVDPVDVRGWRPGVRASTALLRAAQLHHRAALAAAVAAAPCERVPQSGLRKRGHAAVVAAVVAVGAVPPRAARGPRARAFWPPLLRFGRVSLL
jgi:hypothetical protein